MREQGAASIWANSSETNSMNDGNGNDRDGDRNAAAIFGNEVSDEALERAAGGGPDHTGAFTVSLCTVMADCPN